MNEDKLIKKDAYFGQTAKVLHPTTNKHLL